MVNVVYDCHLPEVMGYPELGYCFRCGDDALLMWNGYFDDLMRAMWTVYGWEPNSDEPDQPTLSRVPLLSQWNEQTIGTNHVLPIAELPATARAFRDAVAELVRAGPNLDESPKHGEALAAFLEQAVTIGRAMSIEECWGRA